MTRTGWKARERQAAALIGGHRFPANTGGPIDVASSTYVVQVKARRVFSLKQVEETVIEVDRVAAQVGKLGLVMLKRSAGVGRKTPWLMVVSDGTWRAMNGSSLVGEGEETVTMQRVESTHD